MWPFTKNKTLPGFSHDEYGNLKYSLTEEEQRAVQDMFDSLKRPGGEFYVKEEYADEITKAMGSQALMFYAKEQITACRFHSNKNEKQKCLEKAIAAIGKAYSFYPLPIYLYDLASFMEMAGNKEAAKNTFREFLKSQSEYKPTKIGEMLLNAQGRDAEYAVKEAEEKS
jgi:tetratricopeptide (TPR) repeat protein